MSKPFSHINELGIKIMPTIAMTEFARSRHTPSQRSHYTGTEKELLSLVKESFDNAKPGYRDGVVLIPVPVEGFYSGIIQLRDGAELWGLFHPRKEGEEPRKQVTGAGAKVPAKKVEIILYRHDVLVENGENETDCDWEIVSINASPSEDEVPIHPDTLMYNHFEMSGGTKTNLSDKDFIGRLRKSFKYWSDKVMAG